VDGSACGKFYFLGEYPGGIVPLAQLSTDGRSATRQDVDTRWKGLETTLGALAHPGKSSHLVLESSYVQNSIHVECFTYLMDWELAVVFSIDEAEFNRYISSIEDRLNQIAARKGATVVQPTTFVKMACVMRSKMRLFDL